LTGSSGIFTRGVTGQSEIGAPCRIAPAFAYWSFLKRDHENQTYRLRGRVDVSLQQLEAMLCQPAVWSDQGIATAFDHLSELIAALPLTTEEYRFAAKWITAARVCWSSGDFGAARFHLEVIRKKVAR
jgi:uncharacterized protein YbjT (DUF2867 family)